MYEIRILNNQEFDELPYKHVKTSLGLADAKNGIAYIRETGVHDIDIGTIHHELDELVAKISPHEEDGIRYKNMGGFFKSIVPNLLYFIPGVGPILGTIANAASAGVSFSKGDYLGGALSAFGGLSGAAKLASNAAKAGAGAAKGIAGSVGAVPANFTNFGGSGLNLDDAFQSLRSGAGSTTSALGQAAKGALSGNAASLIGSAAQAGAGLLDKFKPLAQTSVTSLMSNSLAPKGGGNLSLGSNYVGSLQNQDTALSRFGGEALQRGSAEYAPAFNESDIAKGINNIDQSAVKRNDDVFSYFRNIRPGASIEGDSAFQKQLGNVAVSTEKEKSDFTNQASQANQQKMGVDRYNELMRVNNLSPDQMKFYIGLAGKPDNEIGQYVGMDPNEFRSIFSGLENFL